MSIWGIANTCLGHGAPIVKRPGPVPNPSVDDGRCSVFQVLQTLAIGVDPVALRIRKSCRGTLPRQLLAHAAPPLDTGVNVVTR